MNFNIGKLYVIRQYFWLLFPTKETTTTMACAAVATGALGLDDRCNTMAVASLVAEYWSKKLKCNVSYVSKYNLITILEQNQEYINILTSVGSVGWIYVPSKDLANECFQEVIA